MFIVVAGSACYAATVKYCFAVCSSVVGQVVVLLLCDCLARRFGILCIVSPCGFPVDCGVTLEQR